LDTIEAFQPWRHVQVQSFAEPALVILSKTTKFEKPNALYYVAGSPKRVCLASVSPEDPAVVFSVKQFRCKVFVKRKLHLQMDSGPEGFVHGASVLDSRLRP